MGLMLFFTDYIAWHYGRALKELAVVWGNFLWFGYHFFSIPVLLRTLFYPVYRIRESWRATSTFQRKLREESGIESFFGSLAVNFLMRLVGFFLRSTIILAGFAFELAAALAFIPVFIFWLLFPLAVPAIFVLGLLLVF